MMSEINSVVVRNDRGGMGPGALIVIVLLGFLGYVVAQVLPFYANYYEVLGHMEAQGKKAHLKTDDEIHEFLTLQIGKMGIPLDPKDVQVIRRGRSIEISGYYEEYLDLDLGGDRQYDLHTFEFSPEVSIPLKK